MSDQTPRPGGSSQVAGIARHGRLRKASPLARVFQLVGIVLAVAIVASAGIASYSVFSLYHQATSNAVTINAGQTIAPPPAIGAYPGGFNVLLVGDDTREGQDGIGKGRDDGGALNDVTMLLHVSGDHTFATAVSFPRDMIVPHPQCSKGGTSVGLPVNTALSYGGLSCVVTVISALTGLPIQFAGLITFTGVIDMTNAVGGVPVCVSGNLNDKESGLHLTSGEHVLAGATALAFLRSRHGVGDGSDLGRISSQQVYLSSLVRTLESSGTLSNPATVYSIATAATKHMQLSTSLAQPVTLVAIAQALKNIPLDRVQFVQYPGSTGGTGIFAGKVQPNMVLGNQLFSLIRADQPFKIGAEGANRGSVVNPHATPPPTKAPSGNDGGKSETVVNGLIGQSAQQQTCSKANTHNGQR